MVIYIGLASESSVHDVLEKCHYLGSDVGIVSIDSVGKGVEHMCTVSSKSSAILQLTNGRVIDILDSTIASVWFRKQLAKHGKPYSREQTLEESILQFGLNEKSKLQDGLLYVIENNKSCLGSYKRNDVSKLEVLNVASKVGLSVPYTVVTTSRSAIESLIKTKYKKLICKSIHGSFRHLDGNSALINYSLMIDSCSISTLPRDFAPSLFQEYIDKEIEIRSFFLVDKFYSMAIFSQSDEKTRVDFRQYNWKKMNRMVPYQLPVHIEDKLFDLMSNLGLNTGSIDLIRNLAGEYVFLEVNPTGQFGFLEAHCRYNLTSLIAERMINGDL